MPTLNTPLGKTLEIGLKTEATYGVPPAGPIAKTFVYSSGLDASEPLENDPILGATQNNGVDATAPAPGLITAGGQVEVPLDLNHIGHWLHLFFGDATVTGAEVKTHVFKSGSLVLPSKTVQQKLAGRTSQHFGLVGRTMRFQLGQAAGFRRVTMELGGRDDHLLDGDDVPLALSAAHPDARVAATRGQLLIDDVVVGSLLSLDGTYDTKLEEDRYVDNSPAVSGWARGEQEASWTGTMTVRWLNPGFEQAARDKDVLDMTVRYAESEDLSLELACPALRLARTGLRIEGPGKLQQQFNFRGHQTVASPMLTATLVNAIAAYS